MLLFRGARFIGRASERADRRRSGTTTFYTKVTLLGWTRVRNQYYNTVTGPGTPLSPPPRNGGPAFFLPLFTRLPRRAILRSWHPASRMAPVLHRAAFLCTDGGLRGKSYIRTR